MAIWLSSEQWVHIAQSVHNIAFCSPHHQRYAAGSLVLHPALGGGKALEYLILIRIHIYTHILMPRFIVAFKFYKSLNDIHLSRPFLLQNRALSAHTRTLLQFCALRVFRSINADCRFGTST